MVETTLRTIAIVTSVFVVISFGFFAHDQIRGASHTQQATVDGRSEPGLPTVHHHEPRRFVEGVARPLLAPFSFLAPSGSRWAARGVTTLVALLVFGFGLGFLARAAKGLP